MAARDRLPTCTRASWIRAVLTSLDFGPSRPLLHRIEAIETTRDLATEAGYFSAIALGGPFLGTVEEDAERPGAPIVTVAQGGTLLPDRDYYLAQDERFVHIRARYVDYLATIFGLAGRANAAADAEAVLALETSIARLQWTRRRCAIRRVSRRSSRSRARARDARLRLGAAGRGRKASTARAMSSSASRRSSRALRLSSARRLPGHRSRPGRRGCYLDC